MCLPLEPYKVEREWTCEGLQCAVVQAREAMHRCGYVRVPPTHPMFGKHYDAVDVDVHGGLTFNKLEPCTTHPDGQGWWFGFDCAHAGDAHIDPNVDITKVESEESRRTIEGHKEMHINYGLDGHPEHYWTEPEVVAETERLAQQLAAMTT